MSTDPFSPPGIVRPAEDVAGLLALARSEHEAGQRAERASLEHYRKAGEALLRAKAAAGHGGWLKLLKEQTSIPQQRASEYMRLAAGWDKLPPGGSFGLKDALRYLTEEQARLDVEREATAEGQQSPDPADELAAVMQTHNEAVAHLRARLEAPDVSLEELLAIRNGSRRLILAWKTHQQQLLSETGQVLLGMSATERRAALKLLPAKARRELEEWIEKNE